MLCGMQTLADIGERGFLAALRPTLATRPDVFVGPGDDCAVVAGTPDEDLVLKSDPVVEGRHFAAGTDPRLVGRKALARVLSDFAAMGAEPRFALVDLVAPPETPLAALEGLRAGLDALARECGVAVVGGDTSRGDRLELHVFCAGAVPRGRALLRPGARPGDVLFVTGPLGRSYESGRHLSFPPRLAEGVLLRDGGATACIDVSDGPACDCWHLARESGVRVELDPAALPLTETCAAMPDPVAHALSDAPPDAPAVAGGRFAAVGRVLAREPGGAVVLPDGSPLPEAGFDHFKTAAKEAAP